MLLVDFPRDESGGQDVLGEVEGEGDIEHGEDLFHRELLWVLEPVPVDEGRSCNSLERNRGKKERLEHACLQGASDGDARILRVRTYAADEEDGWSDNNPSIPSPN